jgi:outer membrane protein assembly factor BamB
MAMTAVSDIKVPLGPALAGERVVAVGHAGAVCLIDLVTGRTLWTRALAKEAGASACDGQPVSVGIADEIVLAGSMGHVFALRLEDGSVQWHVEQRARGAGETSLAVGGAFGDYVARLES